MPSIDKPYPSWILDEANDRWVAPVDYPDTNFIYTWDEENGVWVHTGNSIYQPFK